MSDLTPKELRSLLIKYEIEGGILAWFMPSFMVEWCASYYVNKVDRKIKRIQQYQRLVDKYGIEEEQSMS